MGKATGQSNNEGDDMKGAQEFLNTEPADLIEMSKQGYFTILLDENLHGLEPALENDGFKVIVPPQGLF